MGEGELTNVAMKLHRATSRWLRARPTEDAPNPLSPPRFSALSVIAAAGPLSLGQLAEAEKVQPPTMSRIVDALVGQGLVTRETRAEDRRTLRIAATDQGLKAIEAGRDLRVQALVGRLRNLADSEIRALARGLELLERVTG